MIAKEYTEFWRTATNLAEQDSKTLKLDKYETKWVRATKHLIGMITMYGYKYGKVEMPSPDKLPTKDK